jgi:hypothetical protein
MVKVCWVVKKFPSYASETFNGGAIDRAVTALQELEDHAEMRDRSSLLAASCFPARKSSTRLDD